MAVPLYSGQPCGLSSSSLLDDNAFLSVCGDTAASFGAQLVAWGISPENFDEYQAYKNGTITTQPTPASPTDLWSFNLDQTLQISVALIGLLLVGFTWRAVIHAFNSNERYQNEEN